MYGDLMSMDNFTNSVSRDILINSKHIQLRSSLTAKKAKIIISLIWIDAYRMMEENFGPQIALELILPNIELERS